MQCLAALDEWRYFLLSIDSSWEKRAFFVDYSRFSRNIDAVFPVLFFGYQLSPTVKRSRKWKKSRISYANELEVIFNVGLPRVLNFISIISAVIFMQISRSSFLWPKMFPLNQSILRKITLIRTLRRHLFDSLRYQLSVFVSFLGKE